MSQFKLLGNSSIGTTTISNCFIDKYMKDANGSQIKIYMYLLRMFSANLPTDVSQIADYFNFMEKDVIRALQYWEKKGVMVLHYDEAKAISGLEFVDLSQVKEEPTLTVSKIEQFAPAVSYEKPPYSANQVKAFKECDDAKEIIMFAEAYLRKQLSPDNIKSLFFFYDELHFSADMIDCLIQYCVDRDKKDFRYIEKVAINWAKNGITTPELAQAEMKNREKTVYAIMRALGKSGNPTETEMQYINRWLKEYAFNMDIISEACGRAVLQTDKNRFGYAEGILKNWAAAGVHTLQDVQTADLAFEKIRASAKVAQKPAAKQTSTSVYNQFSQNTYDYDALEKELVIY